MQENKWQKKNTLVALRLCAFRCPRKGFSTEVFYYLSKKLPLSQKLRYFRAVYCSMFRGSRLSQCFILYQRLSIARYQWIRCYAKMTFSIIVQSLHYTRVSPLLWQLILLIVTLLRWHPTPTGDGVGLSVWCCQVSNY